MAFLCGRKGRAYTRFGYGLIQWCGGDFFVNSCELTASITAVANGLACKLTEDELNLLGVSLTQLGDTLITIATQRSICSRNNKP